MECKYPYLALAVMFLVMCICLPVCRPLSVQGLIPSPLPTRSNLFMTMSKFGVFAHSWKFQFLHMTRSIEANELLFDMHTC